MADVKVRLKDLGPLAETLSGTERLVADSSENGTRVQTVDNHITQVGQALRAAPGTHKIATLADDGKLYGSQERTNAATPRGTWNAATNTPTLADSDGYTVGDYLEVATGGTRNLGSGNITFAAGDVVKKASGGTWYKVTAVANVLNGSATAATARTVLGVWGKSDQAGLTKKRGGVRIFRSGISNITIPVGPFQFTDGMDFTLHFNYSNVVKSAGVDYVMESHNASFPGFEIRYTAAGNLEMAFYGDPSATNYLLATGALPASVDNLALTIRVDRDGFATAFHNGTQIGTPIGVSAELADIIASNTDSARIGLSTTDSSLEATVHDFLVFNRALSDSEIAELARSARVKTNDVYGDADTPNAATYDSDFSAGANGWADLDSELTITGNVDAVSDGTTSKDNVLQLEPSTNNTQHRTNKTSAYVANREALTIIEYFIPNTNSNVTRFAIKNTTTLSLIKNCLTQGAWITEYIRHIPNSDGVYIEPMTAAPSGTFAGGGGGDDRIYIARFETYRLGCTFKLDGDDYAGGSSWLGREGGGSLSEVCAVTNGTGISRHGPLRIASKTGAGTTPVIQVENDSGLVLEINEDGHIIATNLPDSTDGSGLAAGTVYHDTTDTLVNGGYPLIVKG